MNDRITITSTRNEHGTDIVEWHDRDTDTSGTASYHPADYHMLIWWPGDSRSVFIGHVIGQHFVQEIARAKVADVLATPEPRFVVRSNDAGTFHHVIDTVGGGHPGMGDSNPEHAHQRAQYLNDLIATLITPA